MATMVQFLNINIGQRVEVRHKGRLYRGTVRYKGGVITKPGDWVGVELDSPDGNHNGTFMGRHYFKSRPLHGIFVDSANIRFIPIKRCLFHRYRRTPVEDDQVEEHLFRTLSYSIHPASRTGSVTDRDRVDILPYGGDPRPKSRSEIGYPKSHLLSRQLLPANSPKRAKSAPGSGIYRSAREDEFCPTPTIPKTHMPHEDQVNLVKRGWGENHLIRESTVSTFRDSLSGRFWNDVSF